MSYITDILKSISHRPWDLPEGSWSYYQEWNKALFLHYMIPAEVLIPLIPKNLELDLYEGKAWISVVAFRMEKIRPRGFPAIPPISNFLETNVRTYVKKGSKQGVFFLNIEAEKSLSAFISKRLSGLPYEKSTMLSSANNNLITIKSFNNAKGYRFDTSFRIEDTVQVKGDLDLWLTERYCLYLERKGRIFRYEIHHAKWPIKNVKLRHLDINYKIHGLEITSNPDLIHYSEGVRVLAWSCEAC